LPSDYHYTLDLSVRDYECDLQGIVNNAVYQNYLEHARHEYLRTLGLDFAQLHADGHDLVLTRCEIDYKNPLHSGETFRIHLSLERQGRVRFLFVQEICRLPDEVPILKGNFIGTCLNRDGRPGFPPKLATLGAHLPSAIL
jgi:acyl-CoA thioester hydrolase